MCSCLYSLGWWMLEVKGRREENGSTALRMWLPSCFSWPSANTTKRWLKQMRWVSIACFHGSCCMHSARRGEGIAHGVCERGLIYFRVWRSVSVVCMFRAWLPKVTYPLLYCSNPSIHKVITSIPNIVLSKHVCTTFLYVLSPLCLQSWNICWCPHLDIVGR